MCGRYTLTSPHDEVAEYFETGTAPELPARYNLAPSQESLIVIPSSGGGRQARRGHWGFTLRQSGKSRLVINARSEDIEHKPTFRESFAQRRCLVPASGFYEWTKIGRTRQPYYFTSTEFPLLGLAGLWSEDVPGGLSYVILTTAANRVVSRVHGRMPVILAKDHHSDWLSTRRLSDSLAHDMFQSWPAADMRSEAVGMSLNDTACDEPGCIEPLEGPVDLFTN